ncbi:AAA family ATPase [Candidatus Pacearchaeota archaeon]|nr:AAA family ATPase [Candidatus Pacearchaeota archaeon]
MATAKEEIKLKVVEALQDDAYKGIARVDPEIMRKLGLKRGDIVSIKGSRESVAIVDRAYPADIGENIIRVDGIIRKNAKTGIGEVVVVGRADIKEAKKITIAPAQKGIMVQGDPEALKPGLLGRAVVKGDIVVLGGTARRRDIMSDMDLFNDIFAEAFSGMGGMGGFGGFSASGTKFMIVSCNPTQPCIITENTEITLNPKAMDISEDKVFEVTYEDIGGLDEELKKIREMVELPLKHPEIFEKLGIEPPKGVLLHGPPGTGKTLLAKAVANEAEANFILLNGPEIMSKFYGESEKNLRDKFDEAEKTAPSIIFIDEIDAIAPKREESYGEVERRVVSQLLTMMDGLKSRGKVVVIGATNRPNSIDPALRRPGRFDREISINVPDKRGRLSILKIHTRNMPIEPPIKKDYLENQIQTLSQKNKELELVIKLENDSELKKQKMQEFFNNKEEINYLQKISDKFSGEEKKDEKTSKDLTHKEQETAINIFRNGVLDELAAITHGFVGADLSSLAKEAAMNVLRKILPKIKMQDGEEIPKEILESLRVTKKDFMEALRTVRPSAMREVLVETPNIKWDDVGGLGDIKQELIEAVEWPMKFPGSFTRMGIRPPRGILLYGPPGTGKTLLAKAVAKESEANFIQVKGPSLLSMWVGKSLPYNEELIVKENGAVKKMKIGEIVEKRADVEILAFDKDKKIAFSRIDDYIKHKLDTNLLEITTRTGRKIKVTDYHSLFSFINGKFTDIPASHLIAGESYIAIPKNLNLPKDRIKNVNLYNYFKNDETIFLANIKDYLIRAKKILGLGRTAELMEVSKKYLADIILKNLPVKITNFENLINEAKLALDFNDIKIKLKGSINEYPAILNIDNDFWRLIGLWVAEGDFNSSTVRIHNTNNEIREDIIRICTKYKFSISEMPTCITINSLFLQKILERVFELFSGSDAKRVPALLFTLDKGSKANFLKGYFSGDGSIYPAENGKFKIEASTISKELANDLMYLFLDFGIVATCYEKELKTGSTCYRISILGVRNFERFSEIGFIENQKNKRIMDYVNSRKWNRSDVIPLSGELYELASQSQSVYSTNKSIGKEALKNMLILIDKDKSRYKEYWELVEGDLFFDLVKEVKIINAENYVYDISVPAGQNFIAGFGGVIAHNSEEGVRKIFERARQVSPCIIFFDEIDSLASRRGADAGGGRVTEQVLNQLLAEMDGLEELNNVIVIGATNRPDMLDPAILRPGRFDRILLVSTPNKEGRLSILKIHTKNMPLAKDVDLDKISELTEGYVGADLESLAREAAMLALRENKDAKEVTKKNFEDAMKKVRPSVSKQLIDKYKKIEEDYLKNAKAAIEKEAQYLG